MAYKAKLAIKIGATFDRASLKKQTQSAITDVQKDVKKIVIQPVVRGMDEVIRDLNQLPIGQKHLKALAKAEKEFGNEVKRTSKVIRDQNNQVKRIETTLTNSKGESLLIQTGQKSNNVTEIRSKTPQIAAQYNTAKKAIDECYISLQKLKNISSSAFNKSNKNQYLDLLNTLKELEKVNEAGKYSSGSRQSEEWKKTLVIVSELQRRIAELNKASARSTALYNKNTEKTAGLSASLNDVKNIGGYDKNTYSQIAREITRINNLIKSASTEKEWARVARAIKNCQKNIDEFKNKTMQAKAQADQTASALEKMSNKKLGLNLSSFISMQQVFSRARMVARDLFDEIRNIDTAMTELKRVTALTEEQYTSFMDGAAQKAESLGRSMTDYINATTEFSRAGFGQEGFENVEKMAETAMILQSVSEDLSANQASEYLVAAVRAYGFEADNAIKIVDKLDNVANKESITVGGLGEAIEKAGSSLSTANNTIEESIALITAANAVVQNPANVGLGIRTISMRMRGIADLGDETGENSDAAELALIPRQIQEGLDKINKVHKTNIQLMEADGKTFRSTYDVLLDMSKIWKDLNDTEKSFFTEKMAGKTRANVLTSLLNNADILKRAYEEAEGSDGAAMTEFEKRSKSIEFHLNQLTAAWQNFSNSLATQGQVTFLIDLARDIVDVGAKIGAVNSLLPIFGATIGAIMQGSSRFGGVISDLSAGLIDGTRSVENMNGSAQRMCKVLESVSGSSVKTNTKIAKLTATTHLLGNTLKSALAGAGIALAIGLVITLISKLATEISNAKHAVDNLEGSIGESKDKITELQAKLDELNGKEIKTDYDNRQIGILEKEIELEQKKLELQEKQRNAKITSDAENYFAGKSEIVSSEFADNVKAVEKSSEAYKKNQEILQEYPDKIQGLKNELNELSATDIRRAEVQRMLNDYEVEYQKALGEESGLYGNLADGLSSLYTERERLESVIENGTDAERASAQASLEKLEALILESEQYAGLAHTLESAAAGMTLANIAIRELKAGHDLDAESVAMLTAMFGNQILAEDGETVSLANLQAAVTAYANSSIEDQINATNQAISNVQARINAYASEMEALSKLSEAMSLSSGVNISFGDVDWVNGKGVWDDTIGGYVGSKNANYLAAINSPEAKQAAQNQKAIERLRNELKNLQTSVKTPKTAGSPPPTTNKDKDKDKSRSGGGRDKETERSTEIWDEYGEKINRVNENLKQFDSLISDANDKISYQDALIEAEGFTNDIYKDQIQTQKELIKHIQDKKEAEELYIGEVSKDYESFMKQIQEAAKAKKIEVGVDFSDVDLDKFLTEYKNAFKDSNADEVTIMGQIVEAAKTARQWLSDADNTVLQLSKDLIQQTAKEWEIDIKYKTNMLDQFSQSRELAQTIYDALSDCVGAEKLRKDIADQLIQSYKDENDAILAVYESNLAELKKVEIEHGKESDAYKSAAKVYMAENNKIHQQAIKNIQSEFALRKQALQDQLEADKKAAERDIYGTTQAAYEREVNKEKKAIQEQIDALRKEADEKDAEEEAKKLQEELEEKEKELADLRIKLDNLNNQRTVKQLTRMDDGSWQWKYVTDQRKIAEAQEEIANKEKEINDTKNKIAKKADEDALENRINALQAQIDAMDKDLEEKQELFQIETESLEEACTQQIELLNKRMQNEIEIFNKEVVAQQNRINNLKAADNNIKKNMETANKEQAELLNEMESNWSGTMNSISAVMTDIGRKISETLAGIRKSIEAAKEAAREAQDFAAGGGSTSAASGYRFVEANNMPFRLHYGERVLTRQEAERYNQIEDEIKSGAVEDMIRNARNESLNTISTVAGSSVKLSANAVPSTTNNATSFVIENISLPNVQNAMDFAKEIQAWAANEFGTLRQRATARLAK